MASPDTIIQLKDLQIGYPSAGGWRIILPPLNASAEQGELIAVIGKNGAGKSTLLRTLAGLQSSLGGEIVCDKRNLYDYSRTELAMKIGYISTEVIKVSNMRIYDLVALGRYPYTNWFGKIDEHGHNIINDSIEKTGISSLRWRYLSELSDGERQKAMIARILAQDTRLMIMDEPTAFLDIGSKFEILHLMHLLSQNSGKTIIFSTHDLNVAISQADKIWLVLENGMIEGAPEDLMLNGVFRHLFDSSSVHYNPENGAYSFTGQDKGIINICGKGLPLHYAKKAVSRAGFSVAEQKEFPYLQVPASNSRKWIFFTDCNSSLEFDTLYNLVRWLSVEWNRPT